MKKLIPFLIMLLISTVCYAKQGTHSTAEIDTLLDEVTANSPADLVTLSGVAGGETDLGSFTGSTITSDITIKAALQELETALEAVAGGHDPITLDANADVLLSLSTQELGFDTQTANYVLSGPATGAAAVPTFRALVAADIPVVEDFGLAADADAGDYDIKSIDGLYGVDDQVYIDLGTDSQITLAEDDSTITINSGITISTGDGFTIGTTQWDDGSDAIDGEVIADDTIDDDSIDWSDVTCADITTSDCGAITSSGTITATTSVISPLFDAAGAEDMDYGSVDVTDHTFTTDDATVIIDGGITISTGDTLTLGTTQWDDGSDKIDGEQIADDTIDDDSIDLSTGTGLSASDMPEEDVGDITITADGDWAVEDDSHSHVISNIDTFTSASLAGQISNETGTGLAVFATSPTLTTPSLGTPSALVLTNATGLPQAAVTVTAGDSYTTISNDADDDTIDELFLAVDTWAAALGGDVSSVGDCTTGACLDGTSDGGTNILLYEADGATTIQTGNNTGAVVLTLPNATGTLLNTDGVGTALTALNGENIQDDTIDDDSIDFTDVTSTDLTFDADTVPITAVYSGTTSLEETTAADDSGAYLIGVFDEFDNSASNNVQDVLDDLDAAIAGIGSGDVTAVGDCADGECLDGTVDGGTNILFYEADGATTLQVGDNAAAVAITLPNATGTLLNTDGVGTALTALNGENIQDDTIDDDSIDFADVTGADLTLTDAGNITSSGVITATTSVITPLLDAAGAEDMDYGSVDVTDHTFTTDDSVVIIDGGITISTGDTLTLGATQWDNGSDAIEGNVIADDSIDDDSIDFGTGADQVSASDLPDENLGDISVSSGAWSINTDTIIEPDLSVDNAPADNDLLGYDPTGTNFEWFSPDEVAANMTSTGADAIAGNISAGALGASVVQQADIDYGDGLTSSGTSLVLDLTDPHTWTATQTFLDHTLTSKTSAPGSPVGGTWYRADDATWDPAGLSLGYDYFVIYDDDAADYKANFDERGTLHVSSFTTVETEFIPVGWMIDGASAPDASATVTSGTEKVDARTFAGDADEDLVFYWKVPLDLDTTSGIKFAVNCVVTSGTAPSAETWQFELQGCSLGTGDALDCTLGTAQTSNSGSRSDAQYDLVDTAYSSAMTSTHITGLAVGENVIFKLYRDVDDTDTYAQNVGVIGVTVKYKRDHDATF